MWKFAQWLIERFDRGSTSAVMTKINQILKNQETIVADIKDMKQDLVDTKANLTETMGDLQEKIDLANSQLTKITDLEKQLEDLKKIVGDLAELDAIATGLKEVKGLSREIADRVPEPAEQPPAG